MGRRRGFCVYSLYIELLTINDLPLYMVLRREAGRES
jgi:hypothetical protein